MPYRIFNIEEVAQYLNLANNDIERLVKDKAIPYEMRGDRAIFRRQDIDAWASQRILGLSATRLTEYHKKFSQRPSSLLNRDSLVSELLQPDYVDATIAAKTRASVIREMVALADRTGLLYDPPELVATLEAREEICSTAVPGGIAFLHPRSAQPYRFDTSFLVLGRTLQGIHYGSPDNQPTDLFVLICCQDDKLHLHTLSRLCLMAQKTTVLADLRAAPDAAAMYECILNAEQTVVSKLNPASVKP